MRSKSGCPRSGDRSAAAKSVKFIAGLDLDATPQKSFKSKWFPLHYRVTVEKKNRKIFDIRRQLSGPF